MKLVRYLIDRNDVCIVPIRLLIVTFLTKTITSPNLPSYYIRFSVTYPNIERVKTTLKFLCISTIETHVQYLIVTYSFQQIQWNLFMMTSAPRLYYLPF